MGRFGSLYASWKITICASNALWQGIVHAGDSFRQGRVSRVDQLAHPSHGTNFVLNRKRHNDRMYVEGFM